MSSHTPRQLIHQVFPSIGYELPITGGWGLSQDDACIIASGDPAARPAETFNGAEVQGLFVEKSIYLELITSAPTSKKCSGIQWKLITQKIIRENSRVFEVMTFEVTAEVSQRFSEENELLRPETRL
jgi:hypothetical protein